MSGPAGNQVAKPLSTTALPAKAKVIALALLLALAALMLPASQAQNAESAQVADVIPVGNRSIGTDRIMTYIKTRPGSELSRIKLQEDVSRLLDTRMFKNVRAEVKDLPDGRVNVYFQIQEFPNLVQEVIYKNAGHLKQKDLDDMTRVRKGAPLDPTTNRNACNAIQDALKKQGRYFATVTLEEGGNPTDKRVVFNVTEGKVVRVRHVNFTGHDELATGQRLRTQTDTRRSLLGMVGGKYNPAISDNDVLKLEDYYKANGYMDVKVTRELLFSDDYQYVDIIYHIHEGQKYRVEDVVVEGPVQITREQIATLPRLRKGDFYNEGVVAADLRNITDFYGWRGYGVSAQKEVFFPEPGLARVVYEVKEKPPAHVGQVIIVGNDVTQDRVIRRVVGLYPGQTLRYPELRIAENDLARLGIFNTDPEKGIRPTLTVLENDSGFHDVLVTVQEAPTGSLMFGAGVNSNAGLVGSIVLNEKNFDLFRPPTSIADIMEGRAFRGAGQEFRIEAVPGTQLQRYSVTFREPFLFDRPYSLTTSGYYYNRIFSEYTEGRVGGRFTLGNQVNREWGISAGLRIEDINVSGVPAFAPVDYTSVIGNNFLVAPRVGAVWDTRDSYLRPTEGGIVDFSYEQGFGAFTFPIFNVEGSRYFTLWQRPDGSGRHVLAYRGHVGWAGNQTPVYERFFAGGFMSIRGFAFRGVGPRINGFNVGGDFLLLNSLEYQLPILANDQLYAVAFVDSGTVESTFSIRDYRVAAGFGLRVTVPMLGPVPIALDFGFPINQAPGDQRQIFAFWVGLFR